MKKVFKVTVDCGHCAQKMESNINKLDFVEEASLNFLTQKLSIVFKEGINIEDCLDDIIKACKKVDRHCEVSI